MAYSPPPEPPHAPVFGSVQTHPKRRAHARVTAFGLVTPMSTPSEPAPQTAPTDAPATADHTGPAHHNGNASHDPLHSADLALRTAETHLHLALREVETLKRHNRSLLGALADAAARGVELQHAAYHDELTGLPNRRLLDAQLQPGEVGAFSAQRRFAVVFIDLDGFKRVNDRHGHAVGDRLLVTVSHRIRSCLRAEDLACRFGGDEFVVLIAGVEDQATIAGIADKIRRHLDSDYPVAGHQIHMRASVGYARYPRDGEDIQTLLNSADASMYRDKPAPLAAVKTNGSKVPVADPWGAGTPYESDPDETPPDRRPLW